jgi:hypothetical protein
MTWVIYPSLNHHITIHHHPTEDWSPFILTELFHRGGG